VLGAAVARDGGGPVTREAARCFAERIRAELAA
jgi:hypothetical protein